MLKLALTDGVQDVFGMEFQPLRGISTSTPPGAKVGSLSTGNYLIDRLIRLRLKLEH